MVNSSMPTPVFTGILQETNADCGIASLATFLRKPYKDVFSATARIAPDAHKKGLWMTQAVKIAAALGRKLRLVARFDRATSTGVLDVHIPRNKKNRKLWGPKAVDHFVVLREGLIWDPSDGTVWHAEDYRKQYKATFGPLICK
jgi:hypothetical protein